MRGSPWTCVTPQLTARRLQCGTPSLACDLADDLHGPLTEWPFKKNVSIFISFVFHVTRCFEHVAVSYRPLLHHTPPRLSPTKSPHPHSPSPYVYLHRLLVGEEWTAFFIFLYLPHKCTFLGTQGLDWCRFGLLLTVVPRTIFWNLHAAVLVFLGIAIKSMFLCVVKCLLWARRALQHNRNIVSLNRLMMTFFPYLAVLPAFYSTNVVLT